MTYPFHGHDEGLVIDGPDTGFARRPMTAAELAAREPALKIARDIYRHANQAGACYAEIWRTIADAHHAFDSLNDGCREFVRMQRELCELLNEDSEGDSLALHDRIVWGIKALRERAEGAV
jgi:hypothetical protein